MFGRTRTRVIQGALAVGVVVAGSITAVVLSQSAHAATPTITGSITISCQTTTHAVVTWAVSGAPGKTWDVEQDGTDLDARTIPGTGTAPQPDSFTLDVDPSVHATSVYKIYDTTTNPRSLVAGQTYTLPDDCAAQDDDQKPPPQVTCDRHAGTALITLRISGHNPYTLSSTGHANSNGLAPKDYTVSVPNLSSSVLINLKDLTTGKNASSILVKLPDDCPALPATTLTAAASKTVTSGAASTVNSVLKSGTTPLAGKTVTLLSRPGAGGAWTTLTTRTTSAAGSATVAITPRANTQYYWRFAGDLDYAPSYSAAEVISVPHIVYIVTTAVHIHRGTTLTMWGTVAPTETGKYVYLEYFPGVWKLSTVKAKIVSQKMPDGKTRVGYVIRFKPGSTYWRTYMPATSTNTAGASATIKVTFV